MRNPLRISPRDVLVARILRASPQAVAAQFLRSTATVRDIPLGCWRTMPASDIGLLIGLPAPREHALGPAIPPKETT